MFLKLTKKFLLPACIVLVLAQLLPVFAQTPTTKNPKTSWLYLDPQNGMTADEAVAAALANNGEIQALRQEVEAARSMIKQAGLRANPKLEASGAQQIGGADNNAMVQGSVPLELGGRRAARIAVAARELEIRESALANQERLLAAEVRRKFGETLADIEKLELTEEILETVKQNYELVAARVREGKIAPLEENIFLVEVNRLRSIREKTEGKVEIAMLELRNLLGKKPEDVLRLRGDFENLIGSYPTVSESTVNALQNRPDLRGAKKMEELAVARLEQARAGGKIDASLTAGYQRMNSSFPVSGFDSNGALRPVQSVFHYFTFGIDIDLPVRNRNQGAIEAAIFEQEAAKRRIEFGELTIRREVSAAYSRYNRAVRAQTIFQNGVRDQARANLEVIWKTYEFGSKTLLDYVAEERRFLEVENELIDAKLETYLANIEILRATNAPELTKK
jgi:cobalt-zinc-cadmium efflux system outer membrane protein